MAKTFLQVQQQIEQLQKEAEQLRKKESGDVLSRIKEAIAVYGFTAADLGIFKEPAKASVVKKSGAKKTPKAARFNATADTPKFKDDKGNVWSGRGPRPAWFKAALESGKSAEDLLAK